MISFLFFFFNNPILSSTIVHSKTQIKFRLLLLLLLSLLSQSLLVFFCASAGCKPCTWSTCHSSRSFCSFSKNLPEEDSCRSEHADLWSLCHSSMHSLILSSCFLPSPSLLYQAYQRPQGSLWLSSTTFSVFPSVRCFYLMEYSYQSVCRWNSLNL